MLSGLRFLGQAASVTSKSEVAKQTERQSDVQGQQTDEQATDRFSPFHSAQDEQEVESASSITKEVGAGVLIRQKDAILSRYGARLRALKEFFSIRNLMRNLGTAASIPIHYNQRPDAAHIARLQGTLEPVNLDESVSLSGRNIADIERLVTNELMQRAELRSTVNAMHRAMLIGILGPLADSMPDDALEIRNAVRASTDAMLRLFPTQLEAYQRSHVQEIHHASNFVSESGDREPANANEIRAAIRTAIDERTAQARAEDRVFFSRQ